MATGLVGLRPVRSGWFSVCAFRSFPNYVLAFEFLTEMLRLASRRKFTAWWYHTFWLSAVPMADAGRPVGFGAAPTCYPYESGGTVNVLTEAAQVELWIDGNKTATANPDPLTAASLPKGTGGHNITAVCLDASGKVTSTNTILSAGTATALQLSLDAPSEKFGSGTHLLLDGHDVAMVRATVVDASGVKVESSTANISFAVASGPGRVLATHNGDNTCHEPNHASWHSAFVGLARAIVQVTEHRIGTPEQRARLAEIDRESAHTRVVGGTLGPSGSSSIVVVASSPGLASATVEIPVSTEEQHSVLAAASRSLAQEQLWTM